jgi:hypothetical protein
MTTANKRNILMTTLKFSSIGLSAFVSAILGVLAFAQVGKTQVKADHKEHSAAMQECAKTCSDCQRACDMCASHCTHLLAEGKNEPLTALAKHLIALTNCQDCATCCAAAAQIVSRGGPGSVLICDCCAKSCDQCAKACEAFPGDKQMKVCAEECRKCEKSCRDMIKHMASK